MIDPPLRFADDVMTSLVMPAWRHFGRQLQRGDRVAVIYHADLDGLLGAAYVCHALQALNLDVSPVPYWIATEDFSFEPLLAWVAETRPAAAVMCDISIANHPERLRTLAHSIPGTIFVYDDHVIEKSDTPPNVQLINPLLIDEHAGKPIPAFLFAYAISLETQAFFPHWLLLLAIFAEGVDEFYAAQAAFLLGIDKAASAIDLRNAFRRLPIAEAGSLIRAEFASSLRMHFTLGILRKIAEGSLLQAEQVLSLLKAELEPLSIGLRRATGGYIDRIEQLIRKKRPDSPTAYLLQLDAVHAVIGPTCSVLRGKFPEHVFIGRSRRDDVFVYELRGAHDSPLNLASLLSEIEQKVQIISQGGHPSGAGALVDAGMSSAFEKNLCDRLCEMHFACEVIDEPALLLDRAHRKS